MSSLGSSRTVAVVTLGCARNEVDSEELAGRLSLAGWQLVPDVAQADVAVVNTCGFIEQAKKDSIDAILEAAQHRTDAAARTRAVVAVGCLAERYGTELAATLPEADAVLGFDSYADLAQHLGAVLKGERVASHVPRDRRTMLPLADARRPSGGEQPAARLRLDDRVSAPVKLASGCDRRCAFCAIPAFRGAFVSRPPSQVLDDVRRLADLGVREVLLVSENSTSYGKDLGDLRLLESLLPRVAAVDGIERVRLSYLQPAEMRPGLVEVIASTPRVAAYFDLSFQHASAPVLRRMRRFGGTQDFLALVEQVRRSAPGAGIRSNVIVGFPGEREQDVEELEAFLEQARLDVVGVFGYSAEEGTEAAGFADALDEDVVAERVARLQAFVEELTSQRAQDRIGERVEVLLEEEDEEDASPVGRAAHQGPDDGQTRLLIGPKTAAGGARAAAGIPAVGELVVARVVDSSGVDLLAEPEAR